MMLCIAHTTQNICLSARYPYARKLYPLEHRSDARTALSGVSPVPVDVALAWIRTSTMTVARVGIAPTVASRAFDDVDRDKYQ